MIRNGNQFNTKKTLAVLVFFFMTAATPVHAWVTNDSFDWATSIANLPFTESLNTLGTTLASDDPIPTCSWQTGSTIWYSITPATPMWIEASANSDYPASLSVWAGSRGSLTQIACGNIATPRVIFSAAAGETYYLMVSADAGWAGGNLVFSLNGNVSPENDDFNHPRVISALPFTDNLSTLGATGTLDDPIPTCPIEPGLSVWYSFTPLVDMQIDVNTLGSNYSAASSVWTGSRGDLTQVACVDTVNRIRATVSVSAGQTYYFMISSLFGGSGGNLVFSVSEIVPPANDDFNSSTPIATLPFTHRLNTLGATIAPDDPAVFPGQTGPTVWYSITPGTDMSIEVSTLESNYFAAVSVWTGNRGSLTLIACGSPPGPVVTFRAVANGTYYVMASTYAGITGGDLAFSVDGIALAENDDFDNATVIENLPYTERISTIEASRAPDDPIPTASQQSGGTVWYSITPGTDMWIEAIANTDYPASLSVWTGSRGSLTEIASGNIATPKVIFSAAAGETYYFMVSAYTGMAGGKLVFSTNGSSPPGNDDFDNAAVISESPFTDNRYTFGSTIAPDDPNPTCLCCGWGLGPTVWYAITPASDVWIEAKTFGSSYPTVLSVWTGSRGSLTQVACGDAATPKVIFSVAAGATYYFMVSAEGGTIGGNLVFSLSETFPHPPTPDPLMNWQSRNPAVQNYNLNGVAYGNGTFVGVGSLGTIITSPNGINWTEISPVTGQSLHGVTYGNGLFLAVGDGGTILSSSDGVDWTPRTSANIGTYRAVAYGNGLFVIVGSNLILTSPDGTNWISQNPGVAGDFAGIAYGNGAFVVVAGDDTIISSPDGIAWTKGSGTYDSYDFLNSVTFGKGIFVAVGYECQDSEQIHCRYIDSAIFTSPDGATWDRHPVGIGPGDRLSNVAYGNGSFVAVGTLGTILTSSHPTGSLNGVTWAVRDSNSVSNLLGVTYGDRSFVVVGEGGTILQSDQFLFGDIATGDWAEDHISLLYSSGITAGCGNGNFCPDDTLTRAQMAVFIEASLGVSLDSLPLCDGAVFNDVTSEAVGEPLCRFIEDFAARGITGGCSTDPPLFCPYEPVTRQQMAIFLQAALGRIPGQLPQACLGTFSDVNSGTAEEQFVCRIVEDFSAQGITGGCGDKIFCPDNPVTRAQMAVFLVAAPEPLMP